MKEKNKISPEFLKELYNKRQISQYFCPIHHIDETIQFSIRLLKACNLACDFCIQGKNNKYKKDFDSIVHCNEVTYRLIDKLNEELRNLSNEKIEIRMFGGETFLLDVFGFIKKIQPGNNKIRVVVVTNGTFFNKIRECITLNKENLEIKFSISIHEDYVDVDKILDDICSIDKKFIHNINVVATGKNDDFIDFLVKNYSDRYKINIQPIRDPTTKIVDEEVSKKYSSMTSNYLLNNEVVSRGHVKNILPKLNINGAICKSSSFARYDYDIQDYLISECSGAFGKTLEKSKLLNKTVICKYNNYCSGCCVKYAFKLS